MRYGGKWNQGYHGRNRWRYHQTTDSPKGCQFTAARDAQIARINELQDFIKLQPARLEAFDEALVKRWLERIIVWEDHFTVELKTGLNIDIEG